MKNILNLFKNTCICILNILKMSDLNLNNKKMEIYSRSNSVIHIFGDKYIYSSPKNRTNKY